MKDKWQTDFISALPLFSILSIRYPNAWKYFADWPTLNDYNAAALSTEITNSSGQLINFIPPIAHKSVFEQQYEPSIYVHGKVQTRLHNWHDFFNMLIWLTFPHFKKTLNYHHYISLKQRAISLSLTQRTSLENILTHLDENGIIIASADVNLDNLLIGHHWKKLFLESREYMQKNMQCFIIGHALYEKALNPYIGMTGSAIIIRVDKTFFRKSLSEKIEQLDTTLANTLLDKSWLENIKKLLPLPILGIPGWWPANNEENFYNNTHYFRPAHLRWNK